MTKKDCSAKAPKPVRPFPISEPTSGQMCSTPAQMTYIHSSGKLASSNLVGLKIFGGWSRGMRKKSLRVISRDRYGSSRLHFPYFTELPHSDFQELVFSSIWTGCPVQQPQRRHDPPTHHRSQCRVPSLYTMRPLCVNGEYWGRLLHQRKGQQRVHRSTFGFLPEEINPP